MSAFVSPRGLASPSLSARFSNAWGRKKKTTTLRTGLVLLLSLNDVVRACCSF